MTAAAPMQTPAAPVTRAAFDAAYDELILGRAFVETKGYYRVAKERYWNSLKHFQRLGLAPGATTLDIGGGQFAVLTARLLGLEGFAGDAVEDAAEDVRAAGLGFCRIDLFSDDIETDQRFDCVTLLEVIEHIPQPPYLVLGRIARLLKPGGVLFMTTPNGHRLRNILYMLANKEILGLYRYPEPGMVLGHQHEYTLPQLSWQLEHAGFEILFAQHYATHAAGHSPMARVARLAMRPADLIPHLRNSLVAAARLNAR